jgi:hypothetical protein
VTQRCQRAGADSLETPKRAVPPRARTRRVLPSRYFPAEPRAREDADSVKRPLQMLIQRVQSTPPTVTQRCTCRRRQPFARVANQVATFNISTGFGDGSAERTHDAGDAQQRFCHWLMLRNYPRVNASTTCDGECRLMTRYLGLQRPKSPLVAPPFVYVSFAAAAVPSMRSLELKILKKRQRQ